MLGGLRKVLPSIINILQDFCTQGQKHKLKDTREGNMGEKKKVAPTELSLSLQLVLQFRVTIIFSENVYCGVTYIQAVL